MQLPSIAIPVRVLTCEDLILHKLVAGRMIDLADVEVLLVANQAELDGDYLRSWAARLGIAHALDERWQAVFGEG